MACNQTGNTIDLCLTVTIPSNAAATVDVSCYSTDCTQSVTYSDGTTTVVLPVTATYTLDVADDFGVVATLTSVDLYSSGTSTAAGM